MPSLRDTEWRLICLIVRQTWGWFTLHGTRKQSDWLTQRQLMARTGRSSEAVSRAIDVLVKRKVIEVRSAEGEVLQTAFRRRRYGGRLYFRVLPIEKVKSTGRKIDVLDAKNEVDTRKIEVRKANTTKEIDTKNVMGAQNHVKNPSKTGSPLTDSDRSQILTAIHVDAEEIVRAFDAITSGSRRGEEPTDPITESNLRLASQLLSRFDGERIRSLASVYVQETRFDQAEGKISFDNFAKSIRSLLLAETREHLMKLGDSQRRPQTGRRAASPN